MTQEADLRNYMSSYMAIKSEQISNFVVGDKMSVQEKSGNNSNGKNQRTDLCQNIYKNRVRKKATKLQPKT